MRRRKSVSINTKKIIGRMSRLRFAFCRVDGAFEPKNRNWDKKFTQTCILHEPNKFKTHSKCNFFKNYNPKASKTPRTLQENLPTRTTNNRLKKNSQPITFGSLLLPKTAMTRFLLLWPNFAPLFAFLNGTFFLSILNGTVCDPFWLVAHNDLR